MSAHAGLPLRCEAMRIAGRRVEADEVVEVLNPNDGSAVGTVPAARPEDAHRGPHRRHRLRLPGTMGELRASRLVGGAAP